MATDPDQFPSQQALPSQPLPPDNVVIVFRTDRSAVRGRLVRMGKSVDTIIRRHDMPTAASLALGQAVTLAALFGSVLPADGKIILQTRTNGAVSFIVADYDAPGRVRGYARYDAAALAAMTITDAQTSPEILFGEGHLAITVDQGDASERYQGVIALDGVSLEQAASAYFEQREAVSTFVRLAVADTYSKVRGDPLSVWQWRAGGLMMQSIAARPEDIEGDETIATDDNLDPHDPTEAWNRVRILSETVEHHELLDETLSPERLLLRLYHEEGVRIERVLPLATYCRCSRDRVFDVLRSFGAKELADMRDDDGKVAVKCEFCATSYAFALSEIDEPQP